jgi:hypothetical protein
MMSKKNRAPDSSDRLTISLGPGQRKALEHIAALNGTTLAFVVRYGLSQLIESHADKQIPLRFPASIGRPNA